MAAELGLSATQAEWFHRSVQPGVFATRLASGPWREPFVFRVPLVDVSTRVTDHDIEESLQPLLSLPTVPASEFLDWDPFGILHVGTEGAPDRAPGSGYRHYHSDAVNRVRFIVRAMSLGFTLTEIGQLLSLRADPKIPCERVRALADEKLSEVEAKFRSLQAIHGSLLEITNTCQESLDGDCPILEFLEYTEI